MYGNKNMQVKSLSHFSTVTIYYKYFLSVIKRIINHYMYENINNKKQKREGERKENTYEKRVELQSRMKIFSHAFTLCRYNNLGGYEFFS
jgi:hypothetical protein